MQLNQVDILTPGKVILSGEHAVVYGAPAFAIPYPRFTKCQFRRCDLVEIQKKKFTFEQLKVLKEHLMLNYQLFVAGKIPIQKVILDPIDVVLYTIATFSLDKGVSVQIETDIPINSGFGSSASMILGLLKGLCQFFNQPLDDEALYKRGLEIENFFHGHSSGLDIAAILMDRPIYFENGHFKALQLETNDFQLIDTGKPISSTGECVSFARKFFQKTSLIEEFRRVTLQMIECLERGDKEGIIEKIRENEKLLEGLGVVPRKVLNFIRDIEKRKGAAKICGAGSIKEGGAGAVIVYCEQSIQDLLGYYNFKKITHVMQT